MGQAAASTCFGNKQHLLPQLKVPIAWEFSSLEQPLWFPSVALIRQHQWYRKQFFQKSLFVHQQPQEITKREFSVCILPRTNVFSLSFFWLFPKTQSNSVAYGNDICLCISSSSSSSPSWMELAGSSCSDSALVSKSCSSRKKLPMPYSSSCAFVSAGETWGDPRIKPANLPDF